MKAKNSVSRILTSLAFWFAASIMLIYVLFPFYWMLKTSFTDPARLSTEALQWWPSHLTLQNFYDVFAGEAFGHSIFNSIVVASGTVILSLLLSILAAYALGKFKFKGKSVLMYLVLAVSVFPQIAVLAGLYTTIKTLGLYNTWGALILSYMIFTLPFTVWTLTAFVKEIPTELEEAAYVDGATPLQTLFKVIMPVMTPAIVTTGLLAFINAWNEYLFALTFTSDSTARTVPPTIGNFSGATQFENPFGQIMAASVIVTLPLIILVLVFQRNIVSGLTAGAVKG